MFFKKNAFSLCPSGPASFPQISPRLPASFPTYIFTPSFVPRFASLLSARLSEDPIAMSAGGSEAKSS